MKRMLAFLLLVLAGSQLARAQSTAATTVQRVEAVSFCDLVQHPDQYNGRTVKTTAKYGASIEESIFFDDACRKSPSDEVSARASFSGDETVQTLDKLSKALKKYKDGEFQATIVAIFSDNYAPGGGIRCLDCGRYKLDVKQVLAVEKVARKAK